MNYAFKSSVVIGAAVADSEIIPVTNIQALMIWVPEGSSITSLTWHASPGPSDGFLPACDEDGVAVVQTVAAGKCYPAPYSLAGACAIKAVGNAAGTIGVGAKG